MAVGGVVVVGADDEGVDEEADEGVEVGVVAAGGGGADGDVGVVGVAV